tara:strand:+ start:88 stop:846 length:759 start_codon:yes stop_codon:yes gene_type:complete
MSFGERLSKALHDAETSQSELSRLLGIRQPSVNAWVKDKNQPETKRVAEIASALNVDAGWLLDGRGDGVGSLMTATLGKFVDNPSDNSTSSWAVENDLQQTGAAWQIIKREQQEAPVRVGVICEQLGINLVEKLGPDSLCGSIVKDGDDYTITVNSMHHPNRQRFTIAHELAHYLQHRHLIGDGVVDDALYRSNLSSKIEREANTIAARILMPDHLLEYIGAQEEDDMEAVALRFGVSRQALALRLGQITFD